MEGLQHLLRAGLPLTGARSSDAVDWAKVAQAARTVLADRSCDERIRLALIAWLSALQDHFPTHAKAIGLDLVWERPADARWIELRRIAVAHLANLI